MSTNETPKTGELIISAKNAIKAKIEELYNMLGYTLPLTNTYAGDEVIYREMAMVFADISHAAMGRWNECAARAAIFSFHAEREAKESTQRREVQP